MNPSNYHLLKEGQEKKVNKVVQLIRKNNFTDEQKQNWLTAAIKLVYLIRKQREIVYMDTEGVEFKFEEYVPEAESNEVLVIVVDDLNQVKHQITDLLNGVILDEKTVTIEALISSRTVKEGYNNPKMSEANQTRDTLVYGRVKDVQGYKELSAELFSNCSDGIAIMLEQPGEELPDLGENMTRETVIDKPEKTFKHKLTEEDFDNNPELNNMGLNVNDEVLIPVNELVEDWKSKHGQEGGTGETKETAPEEKPAATEEVKKPDNDVFIE